MNLFRNRSLKQQSIILAVTFLAVIVLQLFWLHSRFRKIDSVQYQIDFARSLQLGSQRLYSEIQQAEQDAPFSASIISLTRQQDLQLQLIETGGRIPGSEVFLLPLQRLPKITYDNLKALWSVQRNQILEFNSQSGDFSKKIVQIQAQSMLVADWYGKLIDDLYDETKKLHGSITTALIIAITFDIIFLIIIVIAFNRTVLRVLKQIEGNTILHTHTKGLQENEIGELATQVNEVIEQLRDATDFVKGIGEGKLDMDYKAELDINYAFGKNKLADELIAMQGKLKAVSIEDQRRAWANEGLTKFVDILRNANDNVQTLGDKIISSLVNYTGANQGGLYILNDDDEDNKFLELISLFAFNIKKFEKQRVKLGEGILGQTFLEKDTTYLTNMPEDYVRITSGLGDTAPKSILIVPLKVDKEVYGIVELASFDEFEPHEISFVEKLGETIASTLSSVKVNQKNKRLLEQSQQQTEEMRAQEEEMRQNMEELTATQEGMNRLLKEAQDKETYLNNLMDASPDAIAAIDRDYRVVLRNNNWLFQQFVAQGIPYEKGYYVLGLFKKEDFEYHKSIYDKAFAGETIAVTKEYFGRKYSISYNPLRSSAGEVIGVSIFAHDESELEGLKARLSDTQKPGGEGSWDIAEEMEKTFRIQLEALKITQEELTGRLRK
ncbi:MAG TPA: GAF domain-containing protein [Cyclobacteriaceae bacterium]|nr:GAF domain-containing protein [Cyclobacteriaceae bacterium]